MGNATNRWLDRLAAWDKARGGTGSDYSLAKILAMSGRSAISNYRRGVSQLDGPVAIRLAELLEVHPRIVIAEVMAERARDERERRYWAAEAKSAAKKLAAVGAVILAASGLVVPTPANANWGAESGSPARSGGVSPSVYYVKQRAREKAAPPPPPLPRFKPGRIVHLARAA